MCADAREPVFSASAASFPSTHWSAILATGDSASPDASQALAELCRKYWYPLYAYIRRHGHQAEDARDLTQEFFARFLEKKYLHLADPQRGRFRSFLLAALKHFLINEWDRAKTAKRGGGHAKIPFDLQQAEIHYQAELADELTPEIAYERRWAMALLEHVQAKLTEDYAVTGRSAQCDALRQFLWGASDSISYAQIGPQLGLTESGVKSAVRRLRGRFRDILRREIAQTVTSDQELEDEIRWLFAAFA